MSLAAALGRYFATQWLRLYDAHCFSEHADITKTFFTRALSWLAVHRH
jgi:hypothetical protein